jgi:hypothetical protein
MTDKLHRLGTLLWIFLRNIVGFILGALLIAYVGLETAYLLGNHPGVHTTLPIYFGEVAYLFLVLWPQGIVEK